MYSRGRRVTFAIAIIFFLDQSQSDELLSIEIAGRDVHC